MNSLYNSYLKMIRDKRGYQYNLNDTYLKKFYEEVDSLNYHRKVVRAEVTDTISLSLLSEIDSLLYLRWQQAEGHITYLQTLSPEIARKKIAADDEIILQSEKKIESLVQQVIIRLETKSRQVERQRLTYENRNYWGFISLVVLTVSLIAFLFIQLNRIIRLEVVKDQDQKILNATRASEELFSTSFEYAAIGKALVSPDGQLLRVNKSLCRLLGYNEAELKKISFKEITHPGDLQKDLEYMQLLERGVIDSYQLEKRYIQKNGGLVWVNLNVSKINNPDGTIKQFITQIQDITGRKLVEERLVESERKFKGIFNATYEFMGLLHTDGTLQEANQTALDFAGLTPPEVVGKKFWDTYWWQISTAAQEKLKESIKAAANGQFIEYEVAVWGKDQVVLTILFNLKPLTDEAGNVVGLVAEGRPVQDMVNARNALLQKNEELKEFASVASHDMKEPLRMVKSFLELLDKKYSPVMDEKGRQYIHFAKDGAVRMTNLINELLQYARLDTVDQQKTTVNTMELVQEVLNLYDNVIKQKRAVVEVHSLPAVHAYPVPLKLMFQNLISNALKYQQKDQVPHIVITAVPSYHCWQFAVQDNGIGIPGESHLKIFKLFTRLNSKTEYEGTGMGLATCKKIAEQHGGSIWVESAPGKGSIFYFTIPE